MNLDQLRAAYERAERLYKGCGCTVYKKEMASLSAKIKRMEAAIKAV